MSWASPAPFTSFKALPFYNSEMGWYLRVGRTGRAGCLFHPPIPRTCDKYQEGRCPQVSGKERILVYERIVLSLLLMSGGGAPGDVRNTALPGAITVSGYADQLSHSIQSAASIALRQPDLLRISLDVPGMRTKAARMPYRIQHSIWRIPIGRITAPLIIP